MALNLPLAAAAAAGVQVGAAMVATRWLAADLGPASLAFLRYTVALLCLLPLLRAHRGLRLPWRDAAAIAALGVLQFGVTIALVNISLRQLDAGIGALLFSVAPLLTMVLAVIIGRERFSLPVFAGVLLSIVGVGLALGVRPGDPRGDGVGAASMLGAALCAAVCAVLYRPYLLRYPTLPLGALAMLATVLALAPVAFGLEDLVPQAAALSAAQWLTVLFIGTSSAIGYGLWLWALKYSTPTRVTVFLGLSPVTATLLGAALLSEMPTAAALFGMVCVVAGLAATSLARLR